MPATQAEQHQLEILGKNYHLRDASIVLDFIKLAAL